MEQELPVAEILAAPAAAVETILAGNIVSNVLSNVNDKIDRGEIAEVPNTNCVVAGDTRGCTNINKQEITPMTDNLNEKEEQNMEPICSDTSSHIIPSIESAMADEEIVGAPESAPAFSPTAVEEPIMESLQNFKSTSYIKGEGGEEKGEETTPLQVTELQDSSTADEVLSTGTGTTGSAPAPASPFEHIEPEEIPAVRGTNISPVNRGLSESGDVNEVPEVAVPVPVPIPQRTSAESSVSIEVSEARVISEIFKNTADIEASLDSANALIAKSDAEKSECDVVEEVEVPPPGVVAVCQVEAGAAVEVATRDREDPAVEAVLSDSDSAGITENTVDLDTEAVKRSEDQMEIISEETAEVSADQVTSEQAKEQMGAFAALTAPMISFTAASNTNLDELGATQSTCAGDGTKTNPIIIEDVPEKGGDLKMKREFNELTQELRLLKSRICEKDESLVESSKIRSGLTAQVEDLHERNTGLQQKHIEAIKQIELQKDITAALVVEKSVSETKLGETERRYRELERNLKQLSEKQAQLENRKSRLCTVL